MLKSMLNKIKDFFTYKPEPLVIPVYTIDFDKVTTIDDIKRILQTFKIDYSRRDQSIEIIKDLLIEDTVVINH